MPPKRAAGKGKPVVSGKGTASAAVTGKSAATVAPAAESPTSPAAAASSSASPSSPASSPPPPAAASYNSSPIDADAAAAASLPLWLTEGSTQRDKSVLCEAVYIYTPDGKRELIRNARVQFVAGRRYGLIGLNGIGKSTLLHHVYAGTLAGFPRYLRVVFVQQHDIVHVDDEVLEYVVSSDAEKKYLEAEEQRLLRQLEEDEEADAEAIQERLESVTDRLAVMDARRASTRASAILTGLGFTQDMQKAKINSLSGGWKQRVALACALFIQCDLLLLDEPTNHLDFPAVRWLEAYLKQVESTLVLVSHDRNFLNGVSTDIIELTEQRLDYYRGDYNSYVKTHDEQLRNRRHEYEVQQKKIAELKQFIEEAKKSDNEGTMNLQKTRQKQLDKMELVPEPPSSKDFKFTFPDPGPLDHAMLEVNNMSFTYHPEQKPPHWLLRQVNLNMDQKARVGILGVNGAGKSTMIKLIRGELQPQEGVCRLNPHARAVSFTQHHIDQLDLTKSTMDYLQFLFPQAKEHQIRGVMGRFGFDAHLVQQKIGQLSGGQRSRVAFAILTWKEPHLIIMDEPTNHLDLSASIGFTSRCETIEALIHALNSFNGVVLLVSHDQYFLSSVAKEYWAFNTQGEVEVFYDLDEAKPFSYAQLEFTATSKDELIKQAQQALIQQRLKDKQRDSSQQAAAQPAGGLGGSGAPERAGKKKRRTKKGAGGIHMAELNAEVKQMADIQERAVAEQDGEAEDGEEQEREQPTEAMEGVEEQQQEEAESGPHEDDEQEQVRARLDGLDLNGTQQPIEEDGERRKKKKKKERPEREEPRELQEDEDEGTPRLVSETPEKEEKRQKKEKKEKKEKKKKVPSLSDDEGAAGEQQDAAQPFIHTEQDTGSKAKVKKMKKRTEENQEEEELGAEENGSEQAERDSRQSRGDGDKKKKNSRQNRQRAEEQETAEGDVISAQIQTGAAEVKKNKMKKARSGREATVTDTAEKERLHGDEEAPAGFGVQSEGPKIKKKKARAAAVEEDEKEQPLRAERRRLTEQDGEEQEADDTPVRRGGKSNSPRGEAEQDDRSEGRKGGKGKQIKRDEKSDEAVHDEELSSRGKKKRNKDKKDRTAENEEELEEKEVEEVDNQEANAGATEKQHSKQKKREKKKQPMDVEEVDADDATVRVHDDAGEQDTPQNGSNGGGGEKREKKKKKNKEAREEQEEEGGEAIGIDEASEVERTDVGDKKKKKKKDKGRREAGSDAEDAAQERARVDEVAADDAASSKRLKKSKVRQEQMAAQEPEGREADEDSNSSGKKKSKLKGDKKADAVARDAGEVSNLDETGGEKVKRRKDKKRDADTSASKTKGVDD